MTNQEQYIIAQYLKDKNLSLDLHLEVSDHFKEQIEHKMDFENKSFDQAFAETQEHWKKDLTVKKRFFPYQKKMTILEDRVITKTHINLCLEALRIYILPFIISIFLMRYYPNYGFYFCFMVHLVLFLIGVYHCIANRKLIKNARTKKNLSFAEAGTKIIVIGTMYIFAFSLFPYEAKYEKLSEFFRDFSKFYDSPSTYLFNLLIFFFSDYGLIVGILFLREYKKSINILKQRINLDF